MAYWIFMKLNTVVVHYLQMCMKEYGCCPKFGNGDISACTCTLSMREKDFEPCKRYSSLTAYWILIKLYSVVVHYLQMCMKEYGCCVKFGKGDNLTYTFTKRKGE